MAGAHVMLDGIGYMFIGITVAWTIILFAAMAFLFRHRNLPSLKMRRLPLVFTAMILLHLYGALSMISYVIGPVAPCSAEYWAMSILFPFGIALFQTANSQFLHVASQQKKFSTIGSLDDCQLIRRLSLPEYEKGWKAALARLKRIDKITRMVYFILLGMALQVRRCVMYYRLMLTHIGCSHGVDIFAVTKISS